MKKYYISATLIMLVAILSLSFSTGSHKVTASVSGGSSYASIMTGTPQINTSVKQSIDLSTSTNGGTFGSVVVTGANSGQVTFYDATTSYSTLRTLTATTSLRMIAQLPANAATGTYTFDVNYYQGLIVSLDSGSMPTTTITYRQF